MLKNFNPRSPHGERRKGRVVPSPKNYFNPRSPHGERHRNLEDWEVQIIISIHAPRTGSDYLLLAGQHRREHFNPRSPHGERPCYNT